MSSSAHVPDSTVLPVPEYPDSPERQPAFADLPVTARWAYRAPRPPFWEGKAFRRAALVTLPVLLASCGVLILWLVGREIGTEGFLVGMALSVLPVPLLISAFLWLDRVQPSPWQSRVFAVAWGACAATLVALIGNEYGTKLLATAFTVTQKQAESWGATFVAPLVEETAKGLAVLLLFLFRRRHFDSVVDGLVFAGLTATGFAFTENILYLGSAFGEDQVLGASGLRSMTAATFFVRMVMTPFAHPLFTAMTGIGFAIAATSRPDRVWRWLAPLLGWLAAMTLHGLWNGSASFSPIGFLAVYGVVMIPVFGVLVWLAIWSRLGELTTVRTQLPVYATAGWLRPTEAAVLGSMRGRALARSAARQAHGVAAARSVREYVVFATHLAFLRARAARGTAGPDFAAHEQELLHHLWQRKDAAQPALAHAAWAIRPPYPPYPALPNPYGGPAPWGAPPPAQWSAPAQWGTPAQWGAQPSWGAQPWWGPQQQRGAEAPPAWSGAPAPGPSGWDPSAWHARPYGSGDDSPAGPYPQQRPSPSPYRGRHL